MGFCLAGLEAKLTDRGNEEAIRNKGLCQVFCGQSVVEGWRCRDHAKIEQFRNRISPLAQQQLVSYVVQAACDIGFSSP